MYTQNLYKIVDDHIKPHIIKKNNRYKKWEYGYNKEHDVVVISKTGEIGEIYDIQNLKIALPKPKDVVKFKSKSCVGSSHIDARVMYQSYSTSRLSRRLHLLNSETGSLPRSNGQFPHLPLPLTRSHKSRPELPLLCSPFCI